LALRAAIVPPCSATIFCTIASPRPLVGVDVHVRQLAAGPAVFVGL
jgi:hypothetical protein